MVMFGDAIAVASNACTASSCTAKAEHEVSPCIALFSGFELIEVCPHGLFVLAFAFECALLFRVAVFLLFFLLVFVFDCTI
jgi:hypothetical protein